MYGGDLQDRHEQQAPDQQALALVAGERLGVGGDVGTQAPVDGVA